MTINNFIDKINSNEKQKVFLVGNTFLLLLVLFIFVLHIVTKNLNLVLCPMKTIAHIPCPLCGGSRCALSFINLDFRSSFMFHPTTMILMVYAIFVELVYIFDLVFKKNFINKIFNFNIIITIYLIATMIQYVVRLWFLFNNMESSIFFVNI